MEVQAVTAERQVLRERPARVQEAAEVLELPVMAALVATAELGGVQHRPSLMVVSVVLVVPVVQLQRALQVLVESAVLVDRDTTARMLGQVSRVLQELMVVLVVLVVPAERQLLASQVLAEMQVLVVPVVLAEMVLQLAFCRMVLAVVTLVQVPLVVQAEMQRQELAVEVEMEATVVLQDLVV